MKNLRFIKGLEEITKNDLYLAGGKGANLGEMIHAGLPVPEGFVLLTNSYEKFVETNGLKIKIENLLKKIDNDDFKSVEEASVKIHSLFENGDIPQDIIEALDFAYGFLGNSAVAVRSSATAEDLPGSSFAGQYDTYLNIKGKKELYKYMKKCWASLWNSRALAYRLKHNIDNKDLGHGVVVQRLIDAEKSGILFTANPVNGRRDQMLLNSSWGLGEAIVGGEVSPDQWIINKNKGIIVEKKIAKKEIMAARKENGIEFREIPKEKQEEISLRKEEISHLLNLGNEVEKHFGSPQDIEWAFENGRLYLVQTRPITSLYPIPEKVKDVEGLRVHINFSLVSQGIQDPITPMGQSVFKKSFLDLAKLFEKNIKDEMDLWWYKGFGGRMFIDLTELLRNEKRWNKVIYNDVFSDQDPLTAEILEQFLKREKIEITRHKDKMTSYLIKKICPCLKLVIPMVTNSLYGTLFPYKAKIKAIEEWHKIIEDIEEERKTLKTIENKLEFIDKHISKYTRSGFAILSYIAPSFKNIEKAQKIASQYLKDTSQLKLVEKSLPSNVTTKMGEALLLIAEKLDEKGKKPTKEDEEVQEFLKKYGHRSIEEMDIGIPRWEEEPEYVLSLIESYMQDQNYKQGLDKLYQGQQKAEEVIKSTKAKLEQAGASRKAKKLEKLLRCYRDVFGLREYSKYVLIKAYNIYRKIFMEIGEELVVKGRIDDKMDVFWLEFPDIMEKENLQEVIKANREAHNRYKKLSAPRILTSTGESIHTLIGKKENALIGLPVSAGVYEGKVKVLNSPEEGFELEKGDVLVARGTNPAWTPLFLNIGGLILETGGPISHGSVVAREYGVPAVVGIGNATSILKDGQIVRVNGETGTVAIIEYEV